MGVRERKKEKPKAKEATKPKEEEQVKQAPKVQEPLVEKKSHKPEVVVEIKETQETPTTVESTTEEMTKSVTVEPDLVMPSWGDVEETEWMYSIPTRKEDSNLWAEEWADYLLEWTEQKKVHVLSLATFISEPPFKNLRNKVDSFRAIADVLVEKEVAEWRDKKKRQLRVYWKPLEDWADILYQWSLKTGKLRLDVKSIVIQEANEDFAGLPEKDIHIVLALMVKKKLAEWIDEKQGAIHVLT